MVRTLQIALIASLILGASCAKNSLSDRDAKLDQLRVAAEIKRRELMIVAGNYRGLLSQPNGLSQNVTLKLEIKDIPTPVEGSVDPLMVPILSGYLRFNFAKGNDTTEYIGFAVQKAEFDPKRKKLDLVASNSKYKDLIIGLDHTGSDLQGSWTAPSIAASGTIHLSKVTGEPGPLGEELRGEYGGILFRENSLYQFGHLTIQTAFLPPDELTVSATMRVIFGDWKSTEYLTYKFDEVRFNPVSGQMVIKSQTSDVTFTGHWAQGELVGEWFSSYTGKMGGMDFKKNLTPQLQPGTLFEALRGTYQGDLKNTNPQSSLPERILISFVTSQDLTQPNGIRVTGNLRLYVGPFGSIEYYEMPFSDIQYNFFTRKLVAKTTGDYKLTLKADVDMKDISGKLYSDAIGEVANVEVKKQ